MEAYKRVKLSIKRKLKGINKSKYFNKKILRYQAQEISEITNLKLNLTMILKTITLILKLAINKDKLISIIIVIITIKTFKNRKASILQTTLLGELQRVICL